MKYAALIVGLLGGVLIAFLGISWMEDWKQNGAQAEAMAESVRQLTAANPGAAADEADGGIGAAIEQGRRRNGLGPFLIGFGLLGAAASAAVFQLRRRGAVVMLLAAAVPAVLEPASLIFGFVLVLAAVFAWFARYAPRERQPGGILAATA